VGKTKWNRVCWAASVAVAALFTAASSCMGASLQVIGICEQPWQAGDTWVPGSITNVVEGSKTLLALGAWWDERDNRTDPPTDSNGRFIDAISKTLPLDDAPLQTQLLIQPAALPGEHVVIPSVIGSSGDGFFLLLEADGLIEGLPVLDSGRVRKSHPFYGFDDPNTIETITVSTDRTAAQAGDLAVVVFVMDNNSNPDIKTQIPEGWTLLGRNDAPVDNVGYMACYRFVTEPGQQSVTFNWSDGSTFVAEAAIVILRSLNTPPILPSIPDQIVDELSLFSLKIEATDAGVPSQKLSYSLLNGPSGATIDDAGLLNWTPSEAQGPSTNEVTIVITDDGSPSLSATNSFRIIVNEFNSAPQFSNVLDQTVDQLSLLAFKIEATDADLPAQNLTYSILSGPAGANIDASGLFSWTPSALQGPGTNEVTVIVSDDGSPSLSATNSFRVVVNGLNLEAHLDFLGEKIINENTPLNVTAIGVNIDLPINVLTFSLVAGPTGMVIDSNTGTLSWTPGEADGPGSFTISVSLTDSLLPPLNLILLSITNSFVVQVQEVNAAPSIRPPPDVTLYAGTLYSTVASAIDPDIPANSHIFSLVTGPEGVEVTPDGQIKWDTSGVAAGDYPVTIRVVDDGLPSRADTKTFVIKVSGAPALSIEAGLNGNVLSWPAIAGQTYRAQFKDDLNSADWKDLGDVTADHQTAEQTDRDILLATNRFYRVFLLP
jgi:hypothetical protein